MAKHQNVPTAVQAEQFDDFVKQWQDLLGLHRWRIERGQKQAKDAMASVEFNDDAKLATYRLGDFGATPINEKSLSQTALHEVLHVFLHELIAAAQDRGAEPNLDAVEHSVINVLETVLYGVTHGASKQKEG
jgi:hypothetical protein